MSATAHALPSPSATAAPSTHSTLDLCMVAGELVRDLIRRDPVLWSRVQADPALRRQFGFDDR